ncbi:MAG TPA: methyltransferase domain-containing protein [Bryobacteraceae bacterium]|nr:methyltransferase domain-containing protein [Bryobacteraceae bacterium]
MSVEFTGERVVPGEVDPDLWNEHLARYVFASRFAEDRRVVDAGCGTGYGTAELARCARSAVGIDVAPDAVRYAAGKFQSPNLSFIAASCATLPFVHGAADLIVAFEVIEHITEWREFLAETRRVLPPSGLLLISTPNRAYYSDSRRITGPNPYHVHEFDHDEFEAALRAIYPEVALILQNHVPAIAFQPCAGGARIELAGDGGRRGDPAGAHFLLALCSAAPLPEPPTSLYLPSTANMLRERERHIEMLETEREQLRREKQGLVEMVRALNAELEQAHAGYGARIAELEQSEREKTGWAQRVQAELTECAALLDRAEQTVIERSEWAQRVQAELDHARQILEMARASRWVKLGRKAGLGPDLT